MADTQLLRIDIVVPPGELANASATGKQFKGLLVGGTFADVQATVHGSASLDGLAAVMVKARKFVHYERNFKLATLPVVEFGASARVVRH